MRRKEFLIILLSASIFSVFNNVFAQSPSADLAIGKKYQGGIIAYILQPGDNNFNSKELHGIIAAPFDQSKNAQWGCYGIVKEGIYSTTLGSGNQNTIDITERCMEKGIAARICSELELNGYSDWFLPSKDELNKLFLSKELIGGFDYKLYYWSSSEYNGYNAWNQYFGNGKQYYNDEINPNCVRAIRYF